MRASSFGGRGGIKCARGAPRQSESTLLPARRLLQVVSKIAHAAGDLRPRYTPSTPTIFALLASDLSAFSGW
jgi:hypothetical protein